MDEDRPVLAGGPPTRLGIGVDGVIDGRTRRYEKRMSDLAGVYRELDAFERASAADPDRVVYRVDEHTYADGPGGLIVGTSTLEPGIVGDEYAMTRGHLHRVADRAELYHCLSGHGILLLDSTDGRTSVVELTAGQAVTVPGGWVHRSVNVGDDPFVTLFCYSEDAGQDYGLIADAGGMRLSVVKAGDSGWMTVPNPAHRGYRRAAQ